MPVGFQMRILFLIDISPDDRISIIYFKSKWLCEVYVKAKHIR